MTKIILDKKSNDEIKADALQIPHYQFLQLYCNNENAAFSSNQDKTTRKFSVRYYLEDLRAGTQWVHLKIQDELSSNILDDNQNPMNFWFEKNEQGFFKSIFVGVESVGCIKAFEQSSKHVNSILSTLCFFYRRPLRVREILIDDSKYHFELSTKKFCPKEQELILPSKSLRPTLFSSVFAIYREGMNSIDLGYRYISFFKIYEAWKYQQEKFFRKKHPHGASLIISEELLAGSFRAIYHSEFIGKTFDDADVVRSLRTIRNHLGHPIIDENSPPTYYHFDDIEHVRAIEAYSNLIERMVTIILDVELDYLAENDSEIRELLTWYNSIKKNVVPPIKTGPPSH